ncbi:dihydrodipicolinate synthase family protein [Diaphorobacter sp. HDW4A]|uniref:dihydrodipicolinate synthase family protein n=1 Tax=Diaphorobacter sp. HDW4A TaxID=2714924 RepID=UPI001409CC39|nr:dihydrodipicolinate synthase family protein [Diaphorobacter sp. HDW4A]QIL79991.1 dihydrodipicolinate synthase family protein [Diaphorobacter sp. HDW4A]
MTENTARSTQVFAPALTPFNADLTVNSQAFIDFCRWLISQGAGLAVFGTNSEANSLGLEEKITLLEQLVDAGIPANRMIPGTGLCALPEAISLTRAAVALGCAGTLTLPPFYFKPASDNGLFAYYANLIEAVGSDRFRLYLYHIPQFTGVPISCDLIVRLIKSYPKTVVGIKDSSGNWENTERMLREFPGFEVYPASEALLEKALPLGAAGCISATANVQPQLIARALKAWGTPEFEAQQAQLKAVRSIFQTQPMIPALKHAVSKAFGDKEWKHVRPPLTPADASWADGMMAQLRDIGFDMGMEQMGGTEGVQR